MMCEARAAVVGAISQRIGVPGNGRKAPLKFMETVERSDPTRPSARREQALLEQHLAARLHQSWHAEPARTTAWMAGPAGEGTCNAGWGA